MSIFKNRTKSKLLLDKSNGAKMILEPGEQFSGSNYYKAYTLGSYPVLEVVEDDGSPSYSSKSLEDKGAGAILRSIPIEVLDGEQVSIDLVATYGGPGQWIQIENYETGSADVSVRINGDPESDFILEAGNIQKFDRGDILVNSISFSKDYSGSTGDASLFLMTTIQPL